MSTRLIKERVVRRDHAEPKSKRRRPGFTAGRLRFVPDRREGPGDTRQKTRLSRFLRETRSGRAPLTLKLERVDHFGTLLADVPQMDRVVRRGRDEGPLVDEELELEHGRSRRREARALGKQNGVEQE